MKINQSLIFALVLLSGLALGNTSFAQTKLNLGSFGINEDSKIELSSNSMVFNTETNITEFFDAVVVTYGGLILSSDKLNIIKNDNLEFYAIGSLSISSGDNLIKANKAHFDTKNQVAIISGNVRVSTGGNTISGEMLELNLKDGIAKIIGSVKTVVTPSGEVSK